MWPVRAAAHKNIYFTWCLKGPLKYCYSSKNVLNWNLFQSNFVGMQNIAIIVWYFVSFNGSMDIALLFCLSSPPISNDQQSPNIMNIIFAPVVIGRWNCNPPPERDWFHVCLMPRCPRSFYSPELHNTFSAGLCIANLVFIKSWFISEHQISPSKPSHVFVALVIIMSLCLVLWM